MKRTATGKLSVVIVASLILFSGMVFGHHGVANLYDMSKLVMLKRKITKFEWTNPHNQVAIKILPDEFPRDTDRVSRFRREAEVLASLNHPNIAAIYDLEEVNGSRFLVLELVEARIQPPTMGRHALTWHHLFKVRIALWHLDPRQTVGI